MPGRRLGGIRMAKDDYPFGYAVYSVREGLSGRAGLAAYRAAGGKVRDTTWFRMVGEARAQLSQLGSEVGADLRAKPSLSDARSWTLVNPNPNNYAQWVSVVMRDRDTGLIFTKPYVVMTPNLMTRGEVVARALDTYTPDSGSDAGVVLGATYTSTRILA